MERRPNHAVVVEDFISTDLKERIALSKDDVVDVISWPSPSDDAEPKLMFKYKGRVGHIPATYLSAQVRLPPGGRLGRIIRAQKEEELTERDDIIPVQPDDIVVVSKILPVEGWWLGEIIHSKANPDSFGRRGSFRPEVVKVLPISSHETTNSTSPSPIPSGSPASPYARKSSALSLHSEIVGRPPLSSSSPSISVPSLSEEAYRSLREDFLRILFRKDMRLFSWLCDVADGPHVNLLAQAIVHLFKKNGLSPQMLEKVIEIEVTRTLHPTTFFRDNTLMSHIISDFSHSVGKDYIISVLKEGIKEAISHPADALEIDPNKLNPGASLDDNISRLTNVVQNFLDSIISSLPHIPNIFRYLCTRLQTTVLTKFSESKYSSIGGFFFLRFLCPAIVSPEHYGLLDASGPNQGASSRRALVLVSKVLQTMANGVEFGKKEPYMIPMNNFIQANMAKVHQFFDQLASIEGLEAQFDVQEVTKQTKLIYKNRKLDRIHSDVYSRLPHIKTHAMSESQSKEVTELLDALEQLFLKLGKPKAEEPQSPKRAFFRHSSRDISAALRRKEKNDSDKSRGVKDDSKVQSKMASKRSNLGQSQIVPETATTSPPASSFAGWLLMKGNPHGTRQLRHKWKKFYFLVVDWELHYYKQVDCSKKIGVIDTSFAIVTQNLAALQAPPTQPKSPNKPAKGQHQFELTYPDKHVLHFSLIPPSTQQDLDTWIAAINKGKEAPGCPSADVALEALPTSSPSQSSGCEQAEGPASEGACPTGHKRSLSIDPNFVSASRIAKLREKRPNSEHAGHHGVIAELDRIFKYHRFHKGEEERSAEDLNSSGECVMAEDETTSTKATSEEDAEPAAGLPVTSKGKSKGWSKKRLAKSEKEEAKREKARQINEKKNGKASQKSAHQAPPSEPAIISEPSTSSKEKSSTPNNNNADVALVGSVESNGSVGSVGSISSLNFDGMSSSLDSYMSSSPTTPTSVMSTSGSRSFFKPARPTMSIHEEDNDQYSAIVATLGKLAERIERRITKDRAYLESLSLGIESSSPVISSGVVVGGPRDAGSSAEELEARLASLNAALATLRTIKL